jgi:hypothetical protein
MPLPPPACAMRYDSDSERRWRAAGDDVNEGMEAGGYPSMSPYPICKDAERLIGFLPDASGGVLLRKFDRPKPTNFITQYRSGRDATPWIEGALPIRKKSRCQRGPDHPREIGAEVRLRQ